MLQILKKHQSCGVFSGDEAVGVDGVGGVVMFYVVWEEKMGIAKRYNISYVLAWNSV